MTVITDVKCPTGEHNQTTDRRQRPKDLNHTSFHTQDKVLQIILKAVAAT